MSKWLTRDWGLKLISLMLAIGLWYYAVGEENIEVTRTVPLKIVLKNSQLSILEQSTDMVQVTLSAPRALLSDLASEQIRAEHVVGNELKTAGEYTFRLEGNEIKLPKPQIFVTNIEPEIIKVVTDELIVQKLEIKPNLSGEPAFGYTVDQEGIQLNPNAVLVEGAKGQLEKLSSIMTEPIDLVGRIRSFRRTVSLDLPPNLKPISEALIDTYIPVKEEFDEKKFENIPVKIFKPANMDDRIEMDPDIISFTLKGSKALLEKLEPEKIFAYVDVTNLSRGDHDMSVQLILPEGVSFKEDKPVHVNVSVKR